MEVLKMDVWGKDEVIFGAQVDNYKRVGCYCHNYHFYPTCGGGISELPLQVPVSMYLWRSNGTINLRIGMSGLWFVRRRRGLWARRRLGVCTGLLSFCL